APLADLEEADNLLVEGKQIGWNIQNGYGAYTGTPGYEPYPIGTRPPRFDPGDRDGPDDGGDDRDGDDRRDDGPRKF
ncbi:MAG TPA: hypothetical protein PKO06_15355, partial [Candidatus Ozemobacteraceae bacterium]|nr:hypothetical protein [Candidatus Ozemobacteraceae bacterium]